MHELAGEEATTAARGWLAETFSWLSSLLLHLTLLLVLALWIMPEEKPSTPALLTLDPLAVEELEPLEDLDEPEPLPIQVDLAETAPLDSNVAPLAPEPELVDPNQGQLAAAPAALNPIGELPLDTSALLKRAGIGAGGLTGRGAARRAALVRRGGGSAASERAVAKALQWLAAHQNDDGSWELDHRSGPCEGRCGDPGSRVSKNAATALALLPFLGAGQTHKEGDYQKTVEAGLYYLVRAMQVSNSKGGALNDGGMMYAHGLAAIALCEAYAMTHDPALAGPAQEALNFIVYAQHPTNGGWRYLPREHGDTSVVGWQIMALKSGHMAYLAVPSLTIKKAAQFLDSVQVEDGAAYGYTEPGVKPSTSAIGLLCRMYLGWPPEHEALERGVARLAQFGPSQRDLYYDYYATQLLFQFTGGKGSMWKRWNTVMRDHLIATQAKQGHEEGSWYLDDNHSSEAGGRLYCTAMAAMILQVYYRHLPLYREAAVQVAFPE